MASAARGVRGRLFWLALVGTLLAMGAHGPLAEPLLPLMRSFRAPVKFLFLLTLPLCLLGGIGLERVRMRTVSPGPWILAPGLLLLGAALLCLRAPNDITLVLGRFLTDVGSPLGREVVARAWPTALGVSGALAVGAALVLWGMPGRAPLAAVLAGLDLLIVNGTLNQSTPATFYRLRPEMAEAVSEAAAQGRYRWFSYGAANTPRLIWATEVVKRESDRWLYELDRQSLLPRTHVLDGLEGAYDEDRVGWSPEGTTLTAFERQPWRYADHHARLRLANVRWVLSFVPLPGHLVSTRAQVRFAEVLAPLTLYELRDALPRAFGVQGFEVLEETVVSRRVRLGDFDAREIALLEEEPRYPERPSGRGETPRVAYEYRDPHTIRLTVEGPPGLVVVLDGHHPAWRAADGPHALTLLRAFGRYRAIPFPGGERTITVRYAPDWVKPALAGLAAGIAGCAGLALAGARAGRPRQDLDTLGDGALTSAD